MTIKNRAIRVEFNIYGSKTDDVQYNRFKNGKLVNSNLTLETQAQIAVCNQVSVMFKHKIAMADEVLGVLTNLEDRKYQGNDGINTFLGFLAYGSELREVEISNFLIQIESEAAKSTNVKAYYINKLTKIRNGLHQALKEILLLINAICENNSPSIAIPNQVMKAMTNRQRGMLQDISSSNENIISFLKSLIKNNTSITDKQRQEDLARINDNDITYQVDCYLGTKFTSYEILFIRAIQVIIAEKITTGEIQNHLGLIYIPWHKIYKECGVTQHIKGGPEQKLSKKIKAVLNEGSNLRKQILVKDEYNNEIMDTKFIIDVKLDTKEITKTKEDNITKIKTQVKEIQNIGVYLKLSSFLFFSSDYTNKLKQCTLMDNKGFVSFRQKNKTQIGFALFIWLERYISQQDKTKILDMNTIIVKLDLYKSHKKNPKRTKEDIERAFFDMIEQKTLITHFKEKIGVKGQLQYVFTNARYKHNPSNLKLKKKK